MQKFFYLIFTFTLLFFSGCGDKREFLSKEIVDIFENRNIPMSQIKKTKNVEIGLKGEIATANKYKKEFFSPKVVTEEDKNFTGEFATEITMNSYEVGTGLAIGNAVNGKIDGEFGIFQLTINDYYRMAYYAVLEKGEIKDGVYVYIDRPKRYIYGYTDVIYNKNELSLSNIIKTSSFSMEKNKVYITKFYSEDGVKIFEIERKYESNEKNYEKFREFNLENGKIIAESVYIEDGKDIIKKKYKNGKIEKEIILSIKDRTMTTIEYKPNGKIKEKNVEKY